MPFRVLYIMLAAASPLLCAAVLMLSQFAQESKPYTTLPLVLIVLLGMLWAAPLFSLRQRVDAAEHVLPGLGLLAVLASSLVLVALPLPNPAGGLSLQLDLGIVLCGMVAVLLSEGLRHLPRAPLLSAMMVYIVCTLLANYTFDSFIPVPLLGGWFGGLVNVGTLFFGITFTQRDRVHHYGRGWVYGMITLAASSNALLALHLGTPLRYVWVSIAAIVISEVMDTQVYHSLLQRNWWLRVAASNAVSIPLDSTIFTVFAFYGEPWASPQWMLQVIVTDIVVKLIVGFVAALRLGRQGSNASQPPGFRQMGQPARRAG